MFSANSFNILAEKTDNCLQKVKQHWQKLKAERAQKRSEQGRKQIAEWRHRHLEMTYDYHMKRRQEQRYVEHLRNPRLTTEMTWVLMHNIQHLTQKLLVKKCSTALRNLSREGACIPEPLVELLKPFKIQKLKELQNLRRLHPNELFNLYTKVSRELQKHEQIKHITIAQVLGQLKKPSGSN